jgi:hypothetical protein
MNSPACRRGSRRRPRCSRYGRGANLPPAMVPRCALWRGPGNYLTLGCGCADHGHGRGGRPSGRVAASGHRVGRIFGARATAGRIQESGDGRAAEPGAGEDAPADAGTERIAQCQRPYGLKSPSARRPR